MVQWTPLYNSHLDSIIIFIFLYLLYVSSHANVHFSELFKSQLQLIMIFTFNCSQGIPKNKVTSLQIHNIITAPKK